MTENMDISLLYWGLLFGSIGFGYFIYGKKQHHIVARYTGIALMVLPYIVTSSFPLVLSGVALMLLPKFYHH